MPGRAIRGHKLPRDGLVDAIASHPMPVAARLQLLGLASVALEAAQLTDLRGIVLGISVIRRMTRDLEEGIADLGTHKVPGSRAPNGPQTREGA